MAGELLNLPLASKWQQASGERERNSAHLGSLVVEPLRDCCQKANQFEKRLLTSCGSPGGRFSIPCRRDPEIGPKMSARVGGSRDRTGLRR